LVDSILTPEGGEFLNKTTAISGYSQHHVWRETSESAELFGKIEELGGNIL
jgi:hypothetical protein